MLRSLSHGLFGQGEARGLRSSVPVTVVALSKTQGSWGKQKDDGSAMHAYSPPMMVLPLPGTGHRGLPALLWLGLAMWGASRERCSCSSVHLATWDPHPSALRFCFAWSKRRREAPSSTAWLCFCSAAGAAAGAAIGP